MTEKQKPQAFYDTVRNVIENASPEGVYLHFNESQNGDGTVLEVLDINDLLTNPNSDPNTHFIPHDQLNLGLHTLIDNE